ncbi:hypothetical protein RB595_006946 [Gaeumannomyces hyphopodioides]
MSAIPTETGDLPTLHPAHFACANNGCKRAKDGDPSANKAVMACTRCGLVAYCCKECKEHDAKEHKKDCESEVLKMTWKPIWIRQRRQPTFVSEDDSPTILGTFKYLWGNVPAIDIVKLRENEGVDFKGDLCLLFPASGDLRNVMVSIGRLPQTYKNEVSAVLNDKEFDVVARNVILLLIFTTVQDADTAADCALHVFYSAFLNRSHMEILATMVRPLIREVCDKAAGKDQEALLAKTWTLRDGLSLRVVLSRRQWLGLLTMTEATKKLKLAKAKAIRDKIVNACEDHRDRHMLCQLPHIRMGSLRFYQDGMLLPFGASRAEFTIPNPTLFHGKDVWPMMDSADPFAGWSLPSVLDSQKGPARQDAYGALYEYVFDRGREFHGQLASRNVSFELYCTDARLLKSLIPNKKFDRIETSNICDAGHMGIESTLDTLGPMLKDSHVNEKATIVTLFVNAVPEMAASLHPALEIQEAHELCEKVAPYLEKPTLANPRASIMSMASMADAMASMEDAITAFTVRSIVARNMARDMDMFFAAYMKRLRFDNVGITRGVEMKEKNTIVEKWPMRFGFNGPTSKGKKDLALALSAHHVGHERYVEWKAIRMPVVEESL